MESSFENKKTNSSRISIIRPALS